MVRELYALADTSPIFGGPASRSCAALRWYTFGVAAFWIHTRFVRRQLAVEAVSLLHSSSLDAAASLPTNRGFAAGLLGWLVRRHNLAAFMLYTAGKSGVVMDGWVRDEEKKSREREDEKKTNPLSLSPR